jgi:hypothetical protein
LALAANEFDVTSVDAVIATTKTNTIASVFVIFVFIQAPQNHIRYTE